MRLWHQNLIPVLPTKQLLGQHRECAALRGNGWGKKHATVDYVFTHHPMRLSCYHLLIMVEMQKRGYQPGREWYDVAYRGKSCQPYDQQIILDFVNNGGDKTLNPTIYFEHDEAYLQECIENLKAKNVTFYQP